jgi:RecA/RadA recombinase
MKLRTGCTNLDDLLFGGINTGRPYGIYGLYNSGKTWLASQLAYMAVQDADKGGLGKDVLYLDTEDFFDEESIQTFKDYFASRWGVSDKLAKNIHYTPIKDVYDLGRYFGMEFIILQEEARTVALVKFPKKRPAGRSEKQSPTKKTAQDENWILRSPIYKTLKEGNYGLVILDSITVPIKSVIPVVTQNLSARASLLQPILSAVKYLARTFNVAFIVTNHGVGAKGSGAMFFGVARPWAESVMLYYVKRWIGILDPLKIHKDKYGERARRIIRYRYPGKDNTMILTKLEKDLGYINFE